MTISKLSKCRMGYILVGLFFLVVLFSCRTDDFLTGAERDWLKQHDQTIDVLFGYDSRPYAFYEDDEYIGILIDYQREIEAVLGIGFNFKKFEKWAELLEYARGADNFIIFGLSRMPEREQYFNFTDSFLTIPNVIVTRKTVDYSSMEKLVGKSVCTGAGYAVNYFLRENYPDIEIHDVLDELEGLRAVTSGEYDAMILSQLSASYIIEQQGLTNLKISGDSYFQERFCAAVSRDDTLLYNLIDKTIKNIGYKRSREIYSGWVNPSSNQLPERIRNIIITAICLAVIILTLLWGWLVSLKRQVARKTKQYRKSESLYRVLMEGSTDAIFLSSGGRFLQINKAFEVLFGYTFEEIEKDGLDVMAMVAPESRGFIRERLDRLSHSMLEPANYEFTGLTKFGEKPSIEISVNYIDTGDSFIAQAILRDTSERKKREMELVAARDKAEESDRLKSAFLANISHEIRTPMNGILGFSDLLTSPELNDGQTQLYAEMIKRSGKRMLNTVNDLIDISMIETGQMELYIENLNINDKLNEVYALVRDEAESKGLELLMYCPPGTQDAEIRTDGNKLGSILLNLLNNALKYTNEGRVLFGYSYREDLEQYEFYVGDSGIGIPAERTAAVFNRFEQAELSFTRTYQGAGLGLAIAKAYVEMLGGRIWFESESGKGSTFYFTLNRS